MKRAIAFLGVVFALLTTNAQRLSEAQLKEKPVFTSLEEALKNPDEVYRLKLRYKGDSLPEEIFQLTRLQELHAQRCKLAVLNSRIGELQNLEYLLMLEHPHK